MSRIVKLIGSGIGLASEAIVARNAPPPGNSGIESTEDATLGYTQPMSAEDDHHRPEDSDDRHGENDEAAWELDEAADESTGSDNPPANSKRQTGVEGIVTAFVVQHPLSMNGTTPGHLPCPVILPQRRPRNKSRGFVRAYAPMLLDCGIDQATFLDFLSSFDRAREVSPIFNVMNAAAFGLHFVPSIAAQVTATALVVTKKVIEEVQTRKRTNSFLDQMNQQFFIPRALFCLLLTYKPDLKSTHEALDISQTIANSLAPPPSGIRGQLNDLKSSSGKTRSEFEIPEAAPLIFPALDAAPDAQKQNALKKSKNFVADYYDRRAQALYAAQHPTSSLSPAPACASEAASPSRYSDPNHPASNGSLVSLLTGGNVNPRALRAGRREKRTERRGQQSRLDVKREQRERGERPGVVGKVLQEDVLYLMIVNMPSQEEMEAARERMEGL